MQLKHICDNIKIIGNDLLHLESKKVQAIEGEDFELAKVLKGEIFRMKKELEAINAHHPLKN